MGDCWANSASYLTMHTGRDTLDRGWDNNAERHQNTADRQDTGLCTSELSTAGTKGTLGTKAPHSTASRTQATAFREKPTALALGARSTYCRSRVEE
jgi:hypothetical protein